MVFKSGFLVGFADLGLRGGGLDFEDFVVVGSWKLLAFGWSCGKEGTRTGHD